MTAETQETGVETVEAEKPIPGWGQEILGGKGLAEILVEDKGLQGNFGTLGDKGWLYCLYYI